MAMVTESEICSDREIFGQAHACCTFSPSPSLSPGPCPRVRKSLPFPLTPYQWEAPKLQPLRSKLASTLVCTLVGYCMLVGYCT